MKLLYLAGYGESEKSDRFQQLLGLKDSATEINLLPRPDITPRNLEYNTYKAFVVPHIMRAALRVKPGKYDGLIINCFYDPGLWEARELAQGAVSAPCESSCYIANLLGKSFSIIVGRKKWIPAMKQNIENYGLSNKLASFRTLDKTVSELRKAENLLDLSVEEIDSAVERDMAEVIILGCTALSSMSRKIQSRVSVPVIDPLVAALKHVEFQVELRDKIGWEVSRAYAYQQPPERELNEWNLFKD